MDFVKKLSEICRVHYEKILLMVVLLGLAGAVIYLNKVKEAEEETIQNFVMSEEKRARAAVKPVNLSTNDAVLRVITNPPALDFSLPHHLFNPVKWQRRPPPDNSLIKVEKGTEIGWPKMTIAKITPLNFVLSFERMPTPGSYNFATTREAAEKSFERKKKQWFANLNTKNSLFTLKDFKGTPEDPTEFGLELTDGTKVTVTKDKPYTRVEGYEADLKYTIDGKTFSNLRVNSPLRFLGEDYIVVAITQDEVVVSARSNDKKYTVRQTAVP